MKNKMKTKITLIAACVMALILASCSTQYKKTKSGLVYKVFPSDIKDSLAKTDNVVKFNVVWKFKDSVLYDSHGKMPQYAAVSERLKDSFLGFLFRRLDESNGHRSSNHACNQINQVVLLQQDYGDEKYRVIHEQHRKHPLPVADEPKHDERKCDMQTGKRNVVIRVD